MKFKSLLFSLVISVFSFAQVPTITSFSPTQAAVGATVTITGSNFSSTSSNNIVRFGSVLATVNTASTTQLTVTVPKGAVYAPISVVVSSKIGHSILPFHIVNPSTASSNAASNANWATAVTYSSGSYSSDYMDMTIASGDFDNDGWPDVVKIGAGSLRVHRNQITTAGTTISSTSFSSSTNLTTDGTANCIVTGDVNSDGKLDIISSSSSGINIFINNSTSGSFSFSAKYLIPTSGSNIVRVADMDLDGLLDFVGMSSSNINIWKNTTSLVSSVWTFSVGSLTSINVDAVSSGVDNITAFDIGDMNLDGKVDVVATSLNGSTGLLKFVANTNSTVGTLSMTYSLSDISTAGLFNSSQNVGIADLDADGDLDVMTRAWYLHKNDNAAGITSNSFSGSFSTLSLSLYEALIGISFADYRGIGRLDITGGTTWDKCWTHFNQGNPLSTTSYPGLMANNSAQYMIGSSTSYSQVNGTAMGVDLNGDDKIDHLVSARSSAYFSIVQNLMGAKVTVSQAITTFNKCVNSASSQQSFTVSGTELQGNIVITPPTGFEISTTSGSGFASTAITLTQTAGTVNTTTIYVRLPASNNTSSTGIMTIASTGTSTVNVSLASTMLADLVVTGSPSTSAQSYCVSGTATALTAAATGPSVTYQWQSATTSNGTYSSAVGGTGVTTNTYTPPTTAAGTLYYRCYFNSSCGNTAGAASGAITVNANNTVGTASSTPTLCVNTALTNITHATTGVTGIGTATGLPAGVTAAFASNTITISGTPTASGTFSYTIPTTGGCGTVNATGTITVNAASTVGAASSSPNVCPGTTITSITHSTSGATGIGTATGMPAGVTAAWASNTITISGAPTTAGTYNYSIPLSGGCGTVNATGTIVAKSSNLAAVTQPSSASQVYCVNATATTLTVLYTDANTYQWYAMDAANWSGQVAISGATTTSYTPPTNVMGTKYYRCSVVACSGVNTSSTVTGAITTTDGSVWTGAVSTDPTNSGNWNTTCGSGNKVIVAGTTNSPVYSDLTIASGETFSLQEGAKVTVNGVLTNSGILNINSGATLVQGGTSTYAGTGTVNVAQKITGGSTASAPNGRFWYLGTPVTGANATTFYSTAASNIVKERDEPNNAWNVVTNSASVALTPGKGYYLRASNGSTSSLSQTSLSLNFTGGGLNNNPTTSAITIPCTRTAGVASEGFNLVSNPYPSYLNWDNVTKTDVSNTMWYRTSTGSNWNSTMVFETYVSGAAGGIGTNLSGNTATKLIPPMQSFWVRVNSGSTTGSITLDNSMRSHFSSFGSSTAGLRSTNDDLKMFLRMNLLQEEDKDQIIVYVNNNSSNEFDAFDGEKMMQVDRPQFYTTSSEKKIVINGLSAINTQKSLPITMELTTTGDHQFMVEDLQVESGNVWLEDKTLGTFQLLNQGFGYKFFAYEGISDDRFVLHLKLIDEPTPNFEEANEIEANLANVYSEGAGIVVIILPTTDDVATDVQIYDASGRVYFTGTMKTLESKIQLEQAKGIYYVSLTSVNGVEVRKVFIQ